MNGLKVYLKSGTTRVYVYAQAVVGIFLIGNALREYEHVQGHLTQNLVAIAAGLLLMLGVTIPKRWRRHLRYVPGILIALGGMAMLWLTTASAVLSYSPFHAPIQYLCYVLMGFGILQPLIDPRHYAYFDASGIKYRVYAFQKRFIAWDDIKGIVYFDQGFDLPLKNGTSVRMRPHNGESQNLRLYIDQMLQNGRQNMGKTTTAPDVESNAMVSHAPMAGTLETSGIPKR
jgi:hypothetical protein